MRKHALDTLCRAEKVGEFWEGQVREPLVWSDRTDEDVAGQEWFDVHKSKRMRRLKENLCQAREY